MSQSGTRLRVADAPSRLGPGGWIPGVTQERTTFLTGRVETLHLSMSGCYLYPPFQYQYGQHTDKSCCYFCKALFISRVLAPLYLPCPHSTLYPGRADISRSREACFQCSEVAYAQGEPAFHSWRELGTIRNVDGLKLASPPRTSS